MSVLLITLALVGQIRVEPEALDESFRGKRIIVEGVYNGVIGSDANRQIRLLHCKAKFLPGRRQLHDVKGAENVEISGYVRVERKEVFVDIQSFAILPSDVARFKQREIDLESRDPNGWYQLADWAAARAKKYPNDELAELGIGAYRRAVSIERRNANGDPETLRKLIKKVKAEKRLKDFDAADIEHEILRAESASLDRSSPEAIREFARRVRDRLPFTDRSEAPPLDAETRASYTKDPIGVFASQDDSGRGRLARYWQAELLDQAHERLYATRQKSPLEIADLAAADLPDYPEFERKWILRAQESAQTRMGELSRREIEELAHRIADELQDPTILDRLLKTWLDVQDRQLHEKERAAEQQALANGAAVPQKNVRTRYELAQTHLEWFDNDPDSIRRVTDLLREVLAIDPSFVPATALLERIGMRQQADGNWANPDEGSSAPISGGSIRVGMSAEKVLATLGEPEGRSRVVTAGRVGHLWTYHGIDETTYISLVQGKDGTISVSAVHHSP